MVGASKKRNIFGLIGLSVLVTFLLIAIAIIGLVYSQGVSLTFYVNETGEKLEGPLYLEDIYLGDVVNGKITLVWQDYYPGELRLDLSEQGKLSSFYFDLTKEAIDYGEYNFYLNEYQLKDIALSVSDYSLDKESEIIFNEINQKRALNGLNGLKMDTRLENIAGYFAKKVIDGEINGTDITQEMVTNKLLESGIFFYGSENYWYGYQINSNMSLSSDFMSSIYKEKYWADRFFTYAITNMAIVTKCSDSKKCFTLLITTQNRVYFEGDLRNNYLVPYDIYYAIDSNGVELNYGAKVNIKFNSTKPAKVYLLKNNNDYDKLINRKSVDELFLITSSNFNKTMDIVRNNTLVIEANSGEIAYNLEVTEAI